MHRNHHNSRPVSGSARAVFYSVAGTAVAFGLTNRLGNATSSPAALLSKPVSTSVAARSEPTLEPTLDTLYRVTELPQQYGLVDDKPLFINAKGDVAGTYEGHDKKFNGWRAFLYHNGKVTDLVDDSDTPTEAVGLNNRGQVLVYREGAKGQRPRPFLWESGKMKEIGPMPAKLTGWHSCDGNTGPVAYYEVCGINDKGQVAGSFFEDVRASGNPVYTIPFHWQNGAVTILTERKQSESSNSPNSNAFAPYPDDGVCNFQAIAINDRCEIVGNWSHGGGLGSSPEKEVTLWKGGVSRKIKVRSERDMDFSSPNAASALNATTAPIEAADSLHPYAMNNQGNWVGTREDHFQNQHACLWSGEPNAVHDLDDGLPTPLGAKSDPPNICNFAYGINQKRQIVGVVNERAFLWTNNGGVRRDLNGLIDKRFQIRLEAAYGINDAGQIVAAGVNLGVLNSKTSAYILTPITK